jgi:hypothetical protein
MNLKERIRFLTDGLAEGAWLSTAEIRLRVGGHAGAVSSAISEMYQSEQLERRGTNPPGCEYRSGSRPVVAVGRGSRPRARTGFQHLARLERENPAEWARITNGGRL